MLPMSWTKKWDDGKEATKQQLVSVIANAPESVLHTELVRTFIENFYGDQKKNLVGYGFIPYLFYLFAAIRFLTATRERIVAKGLFETELGFGDSLTIVLMILGTLLFTRYETL